MREYGTVGAKIRYRFKVQPIEANSSHLTTVQIKRKAHLNDVNLKNYGKKIWLL